jgi:hypothetical protein
MKRITLAAMMLAGMLVIAGCTTGRYAQYSRPHPLGTDSLSQMKKADVIKLSKAGVSDSLIVSMINVTDSWFDLRTQDVVDLKRAGVSEKVIDAMIGTNTPQQNTDRYYSADYPYYYPPYYWYSGFYPYWYYPSFYFGYHYYRPFYGHRYIYPYTTHYGNYGMRSGVRSGGRRR